LPLRASGMKFDPGHPHRRSIRLKEYDYSQVGSYFITIVAQDRACLFGQVVDGDMGLNAAGQMLVTQWNALPNRFPTIELDASAVMPDHVHGIIVITKNHESDPVGAGLVPAPSDHWATMVPASAESPHDAHGQTMAQPHSGELHRGQPRPNRLHASRAKELPLKLLPN
jgi:hypothetical protein